MAPAPSKKAPKRALFVLVIVSALLLGAVISPLAKAFFVAAVLAGALYPAVSAVSRRLGNRRPVAAGLAIAVVALTIVSPLTGLSVFVVNESKKAVEFVTETVRSEGMTGLLERLPPVVQRAVRWIAGALPGEWEELSARLSEQLGIQSGRAAAAVGGVVSATGSLIFQVVMMLIALYALLVDGGKLINWLEQVSPLGHGQLTELLMEFRRTSIAVMLSSVATAGVQALTAMVGFFIARVPQPLFFTAVTFFLAFVPAIGAAGVCLAAALLLLVTGHTIAAAFLAIWAVAVVGLIDNVLKPIFARRGWEMNAVVIFFSLIGGIAAFGVLGLLLGPLSVAFFLAVLRIWHRTYGGGPPAAEAVAQATRPDSPVPGA